MRSTVIDTGKHVVVRFIQGCSEPNCDETWTCTRARMRQISEEDWGNQSCPKHRVHQDYRRARMKGIENGNQDQVYD